MRTIRGLCCCALVAVVAVGGGLLSAAEQAKPAAGAAAPAKYACFEVDGSMPETLPPVYLMETTEGTLHAVLDGLGKARTDPQVRGLIVKVGDVGAGWAKVQEVRQELARCRQGGKQVVCVLEGGGNMGYYLATAADRVVLLPSGQLMLVGLRAEAIFLKGLLDKIGVKGDFVQAGKYKSAVESFTQTGPSPAAREELESVLDDYYQQLLAAVAEGRHVPESRAAALLRDGPYTAAQAKAAGLVDDVMFYDELVTDLARSGGPRFEVVTDYGRGERPEVPKPGSMGFLSMLLGGGPTRRAGVTGPSIAVIYAVGPILSEETDGLLFGEEMVSSRTLAKTIRKAAEDANVKAIVLRVDSPGGSADAADEIWHELRLADAKKPVLASLSDVAASGGYYIAAGARKIYADPGCLTGSIGVFGGKLVLAGLLEKVGLNVAIVERGRHGGIESPLSEFTPDERRKVAELVEDTYRLFLARVAATRPKMSVEDVDKVAQGRVWTGAQAYTNGLVDALGGLGEAIDGAKAAAGIPAGQAVEVIQLPKPRSLFEYLLFGEESAQTPGLWGAAALPGPLARVRPYVAALMALDGELSICMMPAVIVVR